MRIAIDCGHGQDTAGKRSPLLSDGSFMREHTFNRAVVVKMVSLLKKNHTVLWVNQEVSDTPLDVRVRRANKFEADIYISIHANAYGNGWNEANGVETLVISGADSTTKEWGNFFQKALVEVSGMKDRGLKESKNLYVLNETKMTAVLLECGFMTNRVECSCLLSDDYRTKLATKLVEVINKKCGIVKRKERGIIMTDFEKRTEQLKALGITDGSRPKETATREEVFAMLGRLFDVLKK